MNKYIYIYNKNIFWLNKLNIQIQYMNAWVYIFQIQILFNLELIQLFQNHLNPYFL